MENAINNLIKHVTSGQLVPLNSLWSQNPVVIAFVRRWGWQLCRAWASQLGNELKPKLDAHGVGLVLIGVEELGIQDFLAGKYFVDDAKIYIDQELKTYKALGFGRCGYLKLPGQLISKDFKDSAAKANNMNIKGDLKGDGMQYGGTYVVDKDGKVLFEHKQQRFSDHPTFNEILNSLGIKSDTEDQPKKPEPVCDENACRL